MTELQKLLFHIKESSHSLWMENETRDSIQLDQWLGDLESFIHDARSCIDDEWREARRITAKPQIAPATLEDLI